ncbi:GerAB/ArcD/ProY family transporter [Paenibacillus sinopodophylli]|uniref:GerAB/ArcD/ProY family transporter n=1 Tax=Paenibacillus sinopodophylli TaxID=1837342 RepID=UPI001487290F|nr:endospore germination permease [Paenibacillus sinopodophylli]
MEPSQKIDIKQMKVLLIFFIVGDLMWFLPSFTASASKQDAWISAIIGVVVGLGIASFIYGFSTKFPGMTLIDINRRVLGRFAGGVLSSFYLLHLLMNGSAQIRVIGDFMTTQMMTETPMRVVLFLFAAVVLISIRTGLPVIARTAQVFFMMFVVLFTILFLLLVPESEPHNLLPLASHNTAEMMRGGFFVIAFPFCQLTVFLMLFPLLEKEEMTFKSFITPVLYGGAAIVLVVTLSILVLGSFMTEHQIYSTYVMAKKISIGNFLQRLEAILVINYLLSTYFKCVISIYAFCRGVTILFGLSDYRVLALPLFLTMFGTAYVVSSDVVFLNSLGPAWALWEITEFLALIPFVYAMHLIRSRISGNQLGSS